MLDADAAAGLFRDLAGERSLTEVLVPSADVAAIASRLAPLRAQRDVVLESVAVNGARADVVASVGDHEWRVVFGSDDGLRVGWVSVFRRPEPFAGVVGGRAVIVNGPSSSGKSTLLSALQRGSEQPWVVFDEPFVGNVAIEHLIWRERSEVLHRGFVDAIAALARAANLVAVAAGGWPQSWFDAAFDGVPTIRVGLFASPDELARRERSRRDVPGGLALSSLGVHDGWTYDLTFDTTMVDIDDIGDMAMQVRHAVDTLAPMDREVDRGTPLG